MFSFRSETAYTCERLSEVTEIEHIFSCSGFSSVYSVRYIAHTETQVQYILCYLASVCEVRGAHEDPSCVRLSLLLEFFLCRGDMAFPLTVTRQRRRKRGRFRKK